MSFLNRFASQTAVVLCVVTVTSCMEVFGVSKIIAQEVPSEVKSESKKETEEPQTDLGAADADADKSQTQRAIRKISLEGPILKTIDLLEIPAQVPGVLQSLKVKEGSVVQKGQDLAKVRDLAVRVELEKARLAMEVARKKKDSTIDQRLAEKSELVAKNEYDRAIEANNKVKDVYPINEVDRLKLIYDRATLERERASYQSQVAGSEFEIAEVEYKRATEVLQRHQILSPCDGMVVAIEKRMGEWLDAGTPVLKIVQVDTLRVEGFVSAYDAMLVRRDTKATVAVEYGGNAIEAIGHVVFVSPDANPVNGQVRVFLEVDNRDQKIRPGLKPKVTLLVEHD